ncbi:MAG: D-arabinono-1,4-lactone oxidase [Peltula sp. TS41687]|nr:MAG: D-arabinono-1,4-lactone oxidase [Peltula sp. TS41687]
MDPIIQRELDRLDPDIPFRASTNHRHHTWAKTFHSRPELFIRPQSTIEIQKIITLARRCRRRLTVVGSAHSPSDLTCTSSWMVNLDDYNRVLSIDPTTGIVVLQSGIRLSTLREKLRENGLAMANLGSIDSQSIAGAISTATHGSSLKHGLLSDSVLSLRLTLANGRTVLCSAEQNTDLFRAALVSLGALGIIVEVSFRAVPAFDIGWHRSLRSLESVLEAWETDLWSQAEFVRVWWIPYAKRAVVWKADKTSKPRRAPRKSWFGRLFGLHAYQTLLYIAQWIPSLLPAIEWLVFGLQYGFRELSTTASAVEEGQAGLLMDCLFSQFVNEWALPLHKGPEAITRLSAWIHGDQKASGIPVSPRGVYVHAPVEVRVSDTSSRTTPRPYLDNTDPHGPTLYFNATLYRPYHADPPGRARYFEAFEYLMKEMGAKPHWAKNFQTLSHQDFRGMYASDLDEWTRARKDVDPEGMFVGDWHRRYVLPDDEEPFPLEEKEIGRSRDYTNGGVLVRSARARRDFSRQESQESFDVLQEAEAEKSVFLHQRVEVGDDDE